MTQIFIASYLNIVSEKDSNKEEVNKEKKEKEEKDEKEENIIGYEAEDDKCCISSPKDSNSRCSSRSACSRSLKSLVNDTSPSESSTKRKGGRGLIMPEPLPLYDGEA